MTHAHRATRRELLALSASAGALAACRVAPPSPLPAAAAPRPPDEVEAALDERIGPLQRELSGQSAPGPIPASAFARRRARLAALLAHADLDALLVEPGPTLAYLTGVAWGRSERLFALVVLAGGEHFWVTPAFEEPKARLRVPEHASGLGFVSWQEHEYAFRPCAAALAEQRASRVAVAPDARFFVADGLAGALQAGRVHSGAAVVRHLRGVKEPAELALLERAAELTQRALARVAEIAAPGTTAAEVGALVARAQVLLGLGQPWVLPLVDAAAAYPHGEHGVEVLQPSSVLLVDTGGTLHGYQSDITRTWVVGGPPSAEVERAWQAVRDAQRRAFETVRPGATGGDVDRAARAAIAAAGYGEDYAALTHRLGHGIGLEGHEEPYFDGGNALPLEVGNVLTDEPGIYVYGRFGVRIEDMLAVTETGARAFGAWQASPLAP